MKGHHDRARLPVTGLSTSVRRLLFVLVFLSGFSGLVYQVVWIRMAFASFGVITPVLSVVISVFMLGLAAGSWAGGRLIGPAVHRCRLSAAFFYAMAEGIIGLGAFAVPKLFSISQEVLLPDGAMNSGAYLSRSAAAPAISVFPWCVAMGTTFPFMMAYVREVDETNTQSFSFLYLANVLGVTGTLLTAVALIELLGFHHTLWVAAAMNGTIFCVSCALGWRSRPGSTTNASPVLPAKPVFPELGVAGTILFCTGFTSMAMEVVWTRSFTPVLKTQVYSFAMIVFTYLGAMFAGSLFYRRHLLANAVRSKAQIMAWLVIAGFLPGIVNDMRWVTANYAASAITPSSAFDVLASIVPFCALLGYLTPSLVDELSAGDPNRAGRAYALNVIGCILGPLAACYILLPALSERIALAVLMAPYLVCRASMAHQLAPVYRIVYEFGTVLVITWSLFFCQDFEARLFQANRHTIVRRDCCSNGPALLTPRGILMTWLKTNTVFRSSARQVPPSR
jgi:spermidine synthase